MVYCYCMHTCVLLSVSEVTMATTDLQPPEPLYLNKTEDWPKWPLQFQRFCLASGLSEKGENAR